MWDDFENAARYKKDKHFYNDLVKIVKKSKFYPHAGKNEILLHGKIVFTNAFDDARKWLGFKRNLGLRSSGKSLQIYGYKNKEIC